MEAASQALDERNRCIIAFCDAHPDNGFPVSDGILFGSIGADVVGSVLDFNLGDERLTPLVNALAAGHALRNPRSILFQSPAASLLTAADLCPRLFLRTAAGNDVP